MKRCFFVILGVSKLIILYYLKRHNCPDNIQVSSTVCFVSLKNAHSCSPSVTLWINRNLVRKGICFACCDRWDVIFFSVDSGHNLHRCFQQHSLHSFPDLCSFYKTSLVSNTLCAFMLMFIPLSVLGVASVTSSVHCSQHTSSSPLVNQAFRLFFSKNCTAREPLTPVFLAPISELVPSWRTREAVLWSIKVSSSTSSTTGSVRSRTSRVFGRIEGKNLWKNMVCSMPIDRSASVKGLGQQERRGGYLGQHLWRMTDLRKPQWYILEVAVYPLLS